MKKIHLTVDKEWVLKNWPKITLEEMCKSKIIQDKPFMEQTGNPIKPKK